MRAILKLGVVLVLVVMLTSSCSESKDSLTKDYVLEYVKQKEVNQPIYFIKRSSVSSIYLRSKDDLKNAKYYLKLVNDGYLDVILRTDIPNPTTAHRPYVLVLTDKAKPFVLDIKGVDFFKTLEFNAVEVKEIRKLSDTKAEVDVLYKKTKLPFHDPESNDRAPNSSNEYPNDTYVKTLEFRKNNRTNEWSLPMRIIF